MTLRQRAFICTASLLVACGAPESAPLALSALAPQRTAQVTPDGGVTGDTQILLAVRNLLDPQRVYSVTCEQRQYLLDGRPFCDALPVVPPGVYEIVAESQNAGCRTRAPTYQAIVAKGQTVEVAISMICQSQGVGQTDGGL